MDKTYNPYELEPFEPTHPGEILGDELKARGISQRKFADVRFPLFGQSQIGIIGAKESSPVDKTKYGG